MSQENVEIVRAAYRAFNEGGFGGEDSIRFLAPGFVFEEPPEQPAPRVAQGRDAAVEMFNQFDEAWEEHQSEIEQMRALDGERVLALTIEHFKGRDGIAIDQPCGSIFTIRDGEIMRMQCFWERKNALEAAGLSE